MLLCWIGDFKVQLRCVVLIFAAILSCYPDVVKGQHSRFKPVTTATAMTRRSLTTTVKPMTTTSTKDKFHLVARKSVVFPEDEETERLPTSAYKTSQQIPLSLLNELNEAADWTEFLKFVDNVTVVQDEKKSDQIKVYGAWEDVDGRSSPLTLGEERDGSIPAKAAHCIPELQTVPLVVNTDASVLYYPTCTRIERCGGCCSSDLLACEPTKTETVLFQVLKTQYTGGSRMKFAGKEIVPMEKHTACKCQCKIKESHCTVNQVYVPSSCRCECSNIDDRQKCEAENQTRYWDSRNCMCRCRDDGVNQQCSTGFYFNEEECRCDPWISRRRDVNSHIFPAEDDNLPHQQPPFINQNNNVVIDRRRPQPARPIYKEDDVNQDEEKKSRPVEHFKFVNNFWNRTKFHQPQK